MEKNQKKTYEEMLKMWKKGGADQFMVILSLAIAKVEAETGRKIIKR